MTITGSEHDWRRWEQAHERYPSYGDGVTRHAAPESAAQRVRRLRAEAQRVMQEAVK